MFYLHTCGMFNIFLLDNSMKKFESLSDEKLGEEYSKIQERKKNIYKFFL